MEKQLMFARVFASALAAWVGCAPAMAQLAPGGPGGSPLNSIPGVTNFDPSILPKARVAMAKVRAGTGRMKIAFIGDSTTAGLGSGTGGGTNSTAARNTSYPMVVTKLLSAAGISATSESSFSDGSLGNLGDTRLSYGTGWAASGPGTLGGALFYQSTTVGTALSFTPTIAVNKCDIYYINNNSGSPIFTVDYDGTGTTTVTPTGGGALLSQSLTPTLGTHTINVKVTNLGVGVYIAGFDCYNTNAQAVSVYNWGQSGSQSSTFIATGSSWSTLTAIATYAPDLTVIDLGINDEGAAVSYATFYANLQSIITQAKLSGDVMLIMHHAALGHDTSQLVTLAVFQALATANQLPLASFMYRLGSWTQANTLGEMNDALHCVAIGYADEAKMISNLLLQL